jgi:pimeloyl-ACP methyl ester carboxylesterase
MIHTLVLTLAIAPLAPGPAPLPQGSQETETGSRDRFGLRAPRDMAPPPRILPSMQGSWTSTGEPTGIRSLPPPSSGPPQSGASPSGEALIYFTVHFGGGPKGTGTGYAEDFMVYAPITSTKPRPMLVIFHKYGVGYLDGWVNTTFFQECLKRGWYGVCPTEASGVHFSSIEGQKNVEKVLGWMVDNFDVDPDRIYGVGFSMGGGAATNYAARHLDPGDSMFAALVDHTGGVALKDTYLNESGPPGWPYPQFVLDYWFGNGTQGSAEPWKLARSSVINFDPQTLEVETAEDLAGNLAHVPIKVTRASNEPPATAYLTTQCDVFVDHFQNTVGGTVLEEIVSYSGHSWAMLDEKQTLNWLSQFDLRLPTNGDVLADEDGQVFFHFRVFQDAAGAFTSFHWSVNEAQNKVLLSNTKNLLRTEVDLARAGLDTGIPLLVVLEGMDGPDDALLEGYPATPSQVLRDGVPITTNWTYDPQEQELLIEEFETGTHTWRVEP